ncbi:hypothetical protein GF389_04635, partial [Candidatus Dojkabacteria bacterium]|nr:hypothetical protein [Candidatus Dojkabacteria bacterium]
MTFASLLKNLKLFDSHCHLNDSSFDPDRNEVVERALKNGVEAIVDIGIDIKSSKKAIQNAEKYDSVYAAVGVDAENLIPGSDLFQKELFELPDVEFDKKLGQLKKELSELASHDKVIMIGETGMDDYWLQKSIEEEKIAEGDREESLKRQEKMFRVHCEIAKEKGKPLSIHSRNAIEKCLQVLEEKKVPEDLAVFHSLTPDIKDSEKEFEQKVRRILGQGYLIGVNGIVTFKNADLIRNVYKKFFTLGEDLEKMYEAGFIFETDAPFLAPEPKRGERNEPG